MPKMLNPNLFFGGETPFGPGKPKVDKGFPQPRRFANPGLEGAGAPGPLTDAEFSFNSAIGNLNTALAGGGGGGGFSLPSQPLFPDQALGAFSDFLTAQLLGQFLPFLGAGPLLPAFNQLTGLNVSLPTQPRIMASDLSRLGVDRPF